MTKDQIVTELKEAVSAITTDYQIPADARIELHQAVRNVGIHIGILDEPDHEEATYEDAMQVLAGVRNGDLMEGDITELVERCFGSSEKYFVDKLNNLGYAVVKIEGMDAGEKLENFIKAELFPYVNDKEKFSIP